jgi:integrase
MATRKASSLDGIDVVHQRHCPAKPKGSAARCKCQPSYRVQVWDPRAGKLQRKTLRVKAEAISWRDDMRVAVRSGTVRRQSRTTCQGAADALLAGMRNGTVLTRSGEKYAPSAVRGYEIGWERVKEDVGHLKLGELARRDVQSVVDRMVANGVPASTVANGLDLLRVVVRRALRDDELSVSPLVGLELPREDNRRERVAWIDEARTLIAALPESDRPLWATAFIVGLRRGELRALRIPDVDLDDGWIHVRRTWDDKEGERDGGKSRAAIRDAPIFDELRPYLVEVVSPAALLRTGRRGDDLVFGRTGSDPFVPTTVRSRALKAWGWKQERNPDPGGPRHVWVKAREDALEPIGLHEARHTAVSTAAAAGVDDASLLEWFGHADVEMSRRYRHAFKERMARGIADVNRLLAGAGAER